MKKIEYESPEFKFEELKLTERVAETCWGVKYGWYDIDGDGTIDANEQINLQGMGSCKSVEDELAKYLNEHFSEQIGYVVTGNDVKTNTHSSYVKPIYS